jgi:hypothetical protein
VLPPERKKCGWACSNVDQAPWKDQYGQVPQRTWAPLFNWVDQHHEMQTLLHDWSDEKYLGWNFGNVLDGCGTIEFRRAPAIQTAHDAKHWVAVAIGLVAHAIWVQDWNKIRATNTYPSTDALRAAISDGIGMLGQNSQGAFGVLADDSRPTTPVNTQERARIEQKKREKRKKTSAYAQQVRLIDGRFKRPGWCD